MTYVKSLYQTAFAHDADLSGFGHGAANILRRSHELIGHGPLLTADDTDAATHAVFGVDRGLHLFGPWDFLHLDGIKGAAFKAVLATDAFFLVNSSLIAALSQKIKALGLFKRKEDFTATSTAEASPGIDQASLFIAI